MGGIYSFLKGVVSSLLLYPISQLYQKRNISSKFNELNGVFNCEYSARKEKNLESLISILEYSKENVPYYRDLFNAIKFDPKKLRENFNLFYTIPYLTKDILLKQGLNMISENPVGRKIHAFKTGGSTGNSVFIYYDQDALDWSSAITLYARDKIGHKKWKSEIHFASRFPEKFVMKDRLKEWFKCFVMNRNNVFFDSLDDSELELIWVKINRLKPNLVHAHPSTMYALALWAKRSGKNKKIFNVFESSGELLDPKKRDLICEALKCDVVDRYGLAEFGVVAYELQQGELQIFDNFVYPESKIFDDEVGVQELVFTGLTNYKMPLIRYKTGDCGEVEESEYGYRIKNIIGRIHDVVSINGKLYPTHYIQDVLDRIGGVKEFQIRKHKDSSLQLTLVLEGSVQKEYIEEKINEFWDDAFELKFIELTDLIKVGWRDKFRYVVEAE